MAQLVLAPEHLLVASHLPELLVEAYKRTTGMTHDLYTWQDVNAGDVEKRTPLHN
eukprot:gene11109-11263_t